MSAYLLITVLCCCPLLKIHALQNSVFSVFSFDVKHCFLFLALACKLQGFGFPLFLLLGVIGEDIKLFAAGVLRHGSFTFYSVGGKVQPTYLSCLIDDATRYIIHAQFYGDMEQSIVEDTMKKGIQKYGVPRRIYFDNGSQYRTHWMKRACGLLGIRLLYARPRNPQGKGKQERFNHTVDSFLAEVNVNPPESIEELNRLFAAWLSECYHSKTHSALGMTPEHAFKSDSMPLRYPDEAILASAFLHCETRKVNKSGCISFMGKEYDVGLLYAGQQVDVVYDPQNIAKVRIEAKGHEPFYAEPAKVGTHVAKKPKRAEIDRIPVDTSRLLDAVTRTVDEKERRAVISYTRALEDDENV